MSEKPRKYKKVAVGFVTQNFEENDEGVFVCTGQTFTCGDEVDYEDEYGENIEDQLDTTKEAYFPYNMVQPKSEKTKVILAVCSGCVSDVQIPSGVSVEIRDYDIDGKNIEKEASISAQKSHQIQIHAFPERQKVQGRWKA